MRNKRNESRTLAEFKERERFDNQKSYEHTKKHARSKSDRNHDAVNTTNQNANVRHQYNNTDWNSTNGGRKHYPPNNNPKIAIKYYYDYKLYYRKITLGFFAIFVVALIILYAIYKEQTLIAYAFSSGVFIALIKGLFWKNSRFRF